MRRTRRWRPNVRARRRPLEWNGQPGSTFLTCSVDTTAGYNLIPVSELLEYTSPTLTRIVGTITVVPAEPLGTGQFVTYSLGLMVTPDVTMTISDWNPATEQERHWMWWKSDSIPWQNFNAQMNRYELDIRVNRKIGDKQELNLYIYNSALSATDLQYQVGIRYLIKD